MFNCSAWSVENFISLYHIQFHSLKFALLNIPNAIESYLHLGFCQIACGRRKCCYTYLDWIYLSPFRPHLSKRRSRRSEHQNEDEGDGGGDDRAQGESRDIGDGDGSSKGMIFSSESPSIRRRSSSSRRSRGKIRWFQRVRPWGTEHVIITWINSWTSYKSIGSIEASMIKFDVDSASHGSRNFDRLGILQSTFLAKRYVRIWIWFSFINK